MDHFPSGEWITFRAARPFGLNREISTSVDCTADGPDATPVRNVWEFVRAWTTDFSERIRDVLSATEHIAPWIAGQGHGGGSPFVVGAGPTGDPLWSKLKPQLTAEVRSVTVVSPYFDAKLEFIRQLVTELHPKHCVVAVHPKFSDIPPNARALSSRTRFVDVSGLADGWAERFTHAKLYRFELVSGEAVVVIGSANASAPAWLASGRARNAELVVVHRDAERLWRRLGLHDIAAAPEVGPEAWSEIMARAATEQEDDGRAGPPPTVAVATTEGFIVDEAFTTGVGAARIEVVGDEAVTGTIEAIEERRDGVLCVCASERIRAAATRLETTPSVGPKRFALVHHVSDLLDKAAGTFRQVFRRALAGMDGDPEELTALLKVVERAIFDDHIALESAAQAPRARHGGAQTPADVFEPDTLAIAATDTVRARRRRRLSASSDLAVIIDALIYRLGQGLQVRKETDTPDSVATPEESLRDAQEELPEVDGYLLAKACRSKVNRLFRRMIGQCEAAVARGKDATTPVIQLAAVLGIVRHLRTREATFSWLPKGEPLVGPDHQREFFKQASRCLYAPAYALAARALAEQRSEDFDELTVVRGLMAWLAFDCELDTRSALDHQLHERDVVREKLVGVAYLLPVVADCARDGFAEEVLSTVLGEQQDKMKNSAAYHLDWARCVTKAFHERRSTSGPIALGDLGWPVKMPSDWPMVVVDTQHSKTGLVDLDTGNPRYFAVGFVSRLQGLQEK